MTIRSNLLRFISKSVVAAQLAFGTMSATALIQPSPAHAATISYEHGAWQGFTTDIDGRSMVGAVTHMREGGSAAFMASSNGMSLVMMDSDWSLVRGTHVPVVMRVDGQVFEGEAIVRGRHLIEMPNVTKHVLSMFIDGAKATIAVDFDDDTVVWNVDLHGFSASMVDSVHLVDEDY